jgi:hypothetical protein
VVEVEFGGAIGGTSQGSRGFAGAVKASGESAEVSPIHVAVLVAIGGPERRSRYISQCGFAGRQASAEEFFSPLTADVFGLTILDARIEDAAGALLAFFPARWGLRRFAAEKAIVEESLRAFGTFFFRVTVREAFAQDVSGAHAAPFGTGRRAIAAFQAIADEPFA